MLAMYKQMLTGQALAQFNLGVTASIAKDHLMMKQNAHDNVKSGGGTDVDARTAYDAVAVPPLHEPHIKDGLRALVTYMAPHKALARQKRWMRRYCRKPADMKLRTFANHITNINEQELPNMPPFGPRDQQMLSTDEIIDIILNGIPRSWTREMDKQDFDPVAKTLAEVIDFCERMEAAEDFDPARNGGKTTTVTKKNGKSSTNNNNTKSNGQGGTKYCLLHGNNTTHNSDDCHVLKKQAAILKGDGGGKMPASKNKTWKRDANKSTSTSKKELAAFVRKQARKELHAFSKEAKKRKVIEDDTDDDNNSQASLNQMDEESEEGEIDISAFNYSKMDDLKIDSDDEDGDEISV
jgi:hypothetical protein